MKYLVGAGVVVMIAVGYFVLSSGSPPAPKRDAEVLAADVAATAPVPAAPVATENVDLQGTPPVFLDQGELLENMAAETRERLPSTVIDTLAMTDARFLPRMRIMEYTYVTTAPLTRSLARDMRALIGASAEALCLEERDMFGMGATLRISFQDRDSTLFQRAYLLPEDCQQFY